MTNREVMKMALDALESWQRNEDCNEPMSDILKALRAALAQPEPEPVAWMTVNAFGEDDDIWYIDPRGKLPEGWTYKFLYTTPPKKEWVGLTDEERNEIMEQQKGFWISGWEVMCMAAVEKKLKEKNT